MAKNKVNRKKRLDPSVTTHAGGDLGWSSIPGRRLAVDIADKNTGGVVRDTVKEHRQNESDDDDNSFDNDDFLNTSNWTSQHYELEDGDAFNKTAESEFWDPDPKAKSNKFDAGAKMEGAHEDGMFLRLVYCCIVSVLVHNVLCIE